MTARGVIIPVSNFRCAHNIFILVGFVVHTLTVHGSPVSGMLQRPVHDGGALYRRVPSGTGRHARALYSAPLPPANFLSVHPICGNGRRRTAPGRRASRTRRRSTDETTRQIARTGGRVSTESKKFCSTTLFRTNPTVAHCHYAFGTRFIFCCTAFVEFENFKFSTTTVSRNNVRRLNCTALTVFEFYRYT